ncbi:hypothetical protein JYU34_015106, partial [Plutella xylostella]
MNFMDTITFRRRPRAQSETNVTDDDINATKTTLDGTTNSMPSFSEDEDEIVKDLKLQIEHLNRDLKAAHEEITNLNLENSELKSNIEILQKENNIYKKVANSLKNDLVTPKKKLTKKSEITPKLNLTPMIDTTVIKKGEEKCATKTSPASLKKSKGKNIVKPSKKGEDKCTAETIPASAKKSKGKNIAKPKRIQTKPIPSKMVILSSNKHNKIMEIAEETYPSNLRLTHLLYPNLGTRGLLEKLEQDEIKNLTLKDICIILLGEEEFATTNNYFELVLHLRE